MVRPCRVIKHDYEFNCEVVNVKYFKEREKFFYLKQNWKILKIIKIKLRIRILIFKINKSKNIFIYKG